MVKKITIQIIQQYLTDFNRRFYLRELAEKLKKPHQTIKPYVENLVKNNILIKEKRTNIVEYSLNFQNKLVYDYLTIAEKDKLIQRVNQDTLLAILFEKLSMFFEKNTFIIFGSTAEKLQKESDIDLLVIGRYSVSKQINDFERIYNKNVHKIQIMKIDKLSQTLLREIYKKHLILNNTEQIIRFFGKFGN